MRTELFRASDLSDELWAAFAQLRNSNSLYDDPFFDPDFVRHVSAVRPDTYVIAGFESDEPVAFWPLHCRGHGLARPIGGPFSDWHGPVLASASPLTPAGLLAGAGLSGFSAFAMPAQLSDMPSATRCGANMTDLSAGWDAFCEGQQALYPRHFKKIRRVTRNLNRDFSDIEYTLDERSEAALDWLITRKRAQYVRTGRHDVLSPDWARAMMTRLHAHQGLRLRARLSTLRVDGQIAAAEFNLLSDTIVHGWITAFDEAYAKYAPGFLLQHDILRRMPLTGLTRYDSGPGLDHYKKFYSNYQLPVDSGTIRAGQSKRSASQYLAQRWAATEAVLPRKAAELMARVRRRSEQILLTETDLSGRARGYMRALIS